jgi:hypothetical protein
MMLDPLNRSNANWGSRTEIGLQRHDLKAARISRPQMCVKFDITP